MPDEKNMIAKSENLPEELKKSYAEDVKSNVEGIEIKFPKIGVDHKGINFVVPTSSGGVLVNNITGIVLHHHRINYLFDNEIKKMLCFSTDSVEPTTMEGTTPQSQFCKSCPKNKYGSGKGRGKMCKNVISVHILLDNESIPFTFYVSPTSIKEYENYVSNLVAEKIPLIAVKTSFSLSRVESGGFIWAKITPKNLSMLTVDEWIIVRKLRDKFLSAMTPKEIEIEEEPEEQSSGADTPF